MVVFESVRKIYDIILSPLDGIFGIFPDAKNIIGGILFLSLAFFGWKAIK